MSSSLPLGDFERDHLHVSWQAGFMTSEAYRVWRRVPSASLLDDEIVQKRYRKGFDAEGHPLAGNTAGLVDFIERAKLGNIAVAQHSDANYIVVRHPRLRTWLALIEDWGAGLTVYSRWAAEGTINYDLPPEEEPFASLITHAQKSSARRPSKPRANDYNPSGADFIDPTQPIIGIRGGGEKNLQPDLVDRFVSWVRDFL